MGPLALPAASQHKVPMESALEVGCGVGGVALELARRFEKVRCARLRWAGVQLLPVC